MMKDKEFSSETFYSRCVKAGQRYYYIDAKRDSKQNEYIVLTESKSSEPGGKMERHRIFIYKEDFEKFKEAFGDVMLHIGNEQEEIDSTLDLISPLKMNLGEADSESLIDDDSLPIKLDWPE
ncbi:DUF3276 family protein [Porphyromonas pogonae]|uniref:DUF3276 family protein n=1 Tax=Porphyromonas pogonae TaxID=867595 RepID=UPI002E793BAA|nr:DUF3276 family protein [Porphyromonas pogonae]